MFLQLVPIFKTMFRKAENVDTRLEIHREEKESHKQHADEDKNDNTDSNFWVDSTVISIDAAREFLKSYLHPNTSNDLQNSSSLSKATPVLSQENKLAMRAYEQTSSFDSTGQEDKTTPDFMPTEEDILNDEMMKIHQLIKDLDILEQRNIHTLTLEKSNNFIESIFLAVGGLKG